MNGKKDVIQIEWNIISAMTKENILSFITTWMKIKQIILHEASQTEKDEYHMMSLLQKLKVKCVKSRVKLCLPSEEGGG